MGDDTCNKALFVANLSSRVTTQQLSELFEKKGTVGKLGTEYKYLLTVTLCDLEGMN